MPERRSRRQCELARRAQLKRLIAVMQYCRSIFIVLSVIAAAKAGDGGSDVMLASRHQQLADLGGEHLAHAVFRRTPQGGAIVAWGERVVEWPLEQSELRELVPRSGEWPCRRCLRDILG